MLTRTAAPARNGSSLPSPPAEAPVDPLLSVKQVAARMNVSTATVHRLIDARDMAHIRIAGRTIRIPASALEDYLQRQMVRHLR
jgi:excisionase family DNA binding protein